MCQLNATHSSNLALTEQETLPIKKQAYHLDGCENLNNFSLLNLLDEIRSHYGLSSGVNDMRFLIHRSRSISCSEHRFFVMFTCPDGHKVWQPLPCGSFFDEKCNKFYADHQRSKLQDKISNNKHREIVFTIPEEIRELLKFENYSLIEVGEFEDGNPKSKKIYEFNRLYKIVKNTLDEYFKFHVRSKPVFYGGLCYPHTYGSQDMEWKPHLNVFVSTLAFCDGQKIFVTTYDYDKIKEIYKRQLEEEFDITLSCLPQIQFDNNNGRSPTSVLNQSTTYFKNVPFKRGFILGVTSNSVIFTTHKRLKNKMSPLEVSHKYFFNLITQHIPPTFYRLSRMWGYYNSNHRYANNKNHHCYDTLIDTHIPTRIFYGLRLIDPYRDLCPKCFKDHKPVLVCFNSRIFLSHKNLLDLNIEGSTLEYSSFDELPEDYKPPPDAYETDHKGVLIFETREIKKKQQRKSKATGIKMQLEAMKLSDCNQISPDYRAKEINYHKETGEVIIIDRSDEYEIRKQIEYEQHKGGVS